MALTIDLSPELERRLEQEAGRHGQDAANFARGVLEERLANLPEEEAADSPGIPAALPRATPEEVQAFLRTAGARPIARVGELQGDFWPDDERVDDFLAARRQWEREGSPAFPWSEPAGLPEAKPEE